jgi:hypothetical protein
MIAERTHPMKKFIALLMFLAATVTPLFAHAGHVHTYMGTVTMLHGEHAFMMKTTDGKDLTVETSPRTTWTHQDGHVAKRSDLAVGDRVVVKLTTDGKTAASVKMGAPKKK